MFDGAPKPASALPEAPRSTPRGDARIAAKPAGHILQILGAPLDADLASRVAGFRVGDAHALRPAGPGVWYLLGDASLSPGDLAGRQTRLGPLAHIVDQTHGRERIELSGPGAVRLLATGTAVDLSLGRFPIGAATETLFGHIGVHLTRTGPERFEVLVGRSYAMSLWEELTS